MKLLVDEIPVLTSDCPFFDLKNCKIDNTKCERQAKNAVISMNANG